MCLLILIDSFVIYKQARSLEFKIFDHAIEDLAGDISLIIQKTNTVELTGLDENARALLLTDPDDKIYYSVTNLSGELRAGDKGIVIPPELLKSTKLFYYESTINGENVRVISRPFKLNFADQTLDLRLQIAETTFKRNSVRDHIVVWIIVPQIILLFACAFFVLLGTKRGLKPITNINDEISALSYRDLEPISTKNVPKEIHKLVESINRLTSELNEAMESQNRFIADVAHQLRTPLAGIFAQIELASNSKDVDSIKERLNYISMGSERLIHMVNQLLRLAKNQPEVLYQVQLKDINLVGLVKKVCLDLSSNADLKKIDLGYEGDEINISIFGEDMRLYDLIYNLLDNAIKYTPDEGRVTASVYQTGDSVCLLVEDDGVGIPEDEQQFIFDRFYRGIDANGFGTGVGLSIVKDIAKLHGASIEIESRGKKNGTKIYVYFKKIDA